MSVAHDFRILKHLALAGLRLEGFGTFADTLQIARGWLESNWDEVHPRLDPDDGDPTFRANALLDFANPDTFLKFLRSTPFVSSRSVGRFSLRDYRVATGKITLAEGAEEAPPTEASISSACMDVAIEDLQATAGSINEAFTALKAIDALLLDKIGGQAPDLKPLVTDLYELRTLLNTQVAQRTGGDVEGGGEGGSDGGGGPGGGRAVSVGQVSIRSREDIVRLLDLVCRYYELNEPASPVPLILQRAKGMVTMNFLELMESVAPSAVGEAKNIFGIKD
jgi:type VI secretion system protein ImpA